jgi:hypothetical protein
MKYLFATLFVVCMLLSIVGVAAEWRYLFSLLIH